MSRRFLLRLLAAAPATDHVPDAELLRRFAATNDAAAFELVVRRHADAVWAACRRILRSEADAEDAFQATFLALLRKAHAVRQPSAGGWLHRVAVHAALKLRERNARTSQAEALDAIPAPDAPPDAELQAVVHEELARLSERERLPVVLCDLEGMSHADAAKALGWPVGTVSGRLSRARAKLRARLERRGLAPAAPLPLLAPMPLVSQVLSPTAVFSPAVATLAEGVLHAMFTAKLKVAAAVLLATGFVALAGFGTVLALAPQPEPPKGPPAPPAKAAKAEEPGVWMSTDPKDPVPTAFPKLLPPDAKADVYAATAKACPLVLGDLAVTDEEVEDRYTVLLMTQLQQGRFEYRALLMRSFVAGDKGDTLDAQLRCLTTMRGLVLEIWPNNRRAMPWLEEFVALGKLTERAANDRVAVGVAPPQVLFAARGHRVAAEAALWKAGKR